MKMKYIILLFLTLAICTVSCKKEDLPYMEEDYASVFFANTNVTASDTQKDSLEYSFVKSGAIGGKDVVFIKVRAIGQVAAFDRPISVKQINKDREFAAKAGVHFLSLESEEVAKNFIIPAGSVFGYLPITVLRDPTVNLDMYTLDLELVENESFKSIKISDYKSFRLKITGLSVKPLNWDTMWTYMGFGVWGSVKMEFTTYVTGFSDWEFKDSPMNMAYISYLRNKTHDKLEEYNAANPGNPLREANGDLVVIN